MNAYLEWGVPPNRMSSVCTVTAVALFVIWVIAAVGVGKSRQCDAVMNFCAMTILFLISISMICCHLRRDDSRCQT